MFNRLECSIYFDDPLCIVYTGTACSGGISISRIKSHSTAISDKCLQLLLRREALLSNDVSHSKISDFD